MSTIPLHCEFCVKTFSGCVPAQQHFASAEHRRKQENLSRSNQRHYCSVCNKGCDTAAILDNHLISPRHNAMVEKQRSMGGNSRSNSINSKDGSPDNEYDFDGNRGYCHVCNIELTSSSHARSHLNGKNHQKKALQWAVRSNTPSSAVTNNSERNNVYRRLEYQEQPAREADEHTNQRLLKGSSDPYAATGGQCSALAKGLFCDICNVGFTGPESQAAHIAGEKHKKNARRLEAEQTGATCPLSCNACNVNFSGPESAEDHFKGPTHARNTTNMNIKNCLTATSGSSFKNVNIASDETFVKHGMQMLSPQPCRDYTDDDDTRSTVSSLDIKPIVSDRHENFGLRFERQESTETDEDKIREELQSTPSVLADDLSHLSLSSFESDISGQSSRVTVPFRVVVNSVTSNTLGAGRGRGVLDILAKKQTMSLGRMLGRTEKEETVVKERSVNRSSYGSISEIAASRSDIAEPAHRSNEGAYLSLPERRGLSHSNASKFENPKASQTSAYSQHVIVASLSDSEDSLGREGIVFGSGTQTNQRESYLSYLSQEAMSASEKAPDADYSFDDITGKGRCFVCLVDFNSAQHMRQHVSGKNHLKAKQNMKFQNPGSAGRIAELPPSKKVFYCDCCNVTISGSDNYQQHLQGAKHTKATKTSTIDPIDKTIWQTCTVCGAKCNTAEQLNIHMKAKHSTEEAQIPVNILYCDVCKVPCSGEDNYKQHVEGAKHKKAAGIQGEMPIMESTDRTDWCVCPTCGVKTNTFKHLEIHMRAKHAQSAVLPAEGNPFDRTSWHKCPVCGSKAIAVEQLQTHMVKTHPTLSASVMDTTRASREIDHAGDRSHAGYKSPLDEFLQEELFPAEFLPTELKDGQSHNINTRIEPEITTTNVAFPNKYALVQEQYCGNQTNNYADISNCKRGTPSDLAYATRNKTVGKQETSSKATVGHIQQSSNIDTPVCKNPYANTHNYYCHTCKVPMNSQAGYEAHINGSRHKKKVCTETAPARDHLPAYDFPTNHVPYTVSKPRNYQFELYRKAMENDALVFLPTGTGKTLVSVMTISAMLEKFPTRNVLFLVDKVLLVLQQSKYIQKELGETPFYRFNDETEKCTELVYRRLRIAALCMGEQSTGGVPLWKHDVIVVTAGFCLNLLDNGIIRWDDFSLVVFDEAHHCEKGHPFNQLLSNFQLKESIFRPKVLGLTASPAGKKDVQQSFGMLVKLVANLGKARMSIVQEPGCVATLLSYQSNANMETRTPMESEADSDQDSQFGFQKSFTKELNMYIVYCVLRLAEVSDIKLYVTFDDKLKPGTAESVIRMLADDFVFSEFDSIQDSLNFIKPKSNIEEVKFSMLISHTQGVCMARSSLFDGGLYCAIRDLDELGKANFNFAKSIGLPTDALVRLQMCDRDLFFMESPPTNMQNLPHDSHVRHLIDILTGIVRDDPFSGGNTISLVLVQQRGTAFHLKDLLQRSERMQQAGLLTTTMVGHGSSGSSAGGMSVKQQKSVLEEIKQNKYQVVVATSVAEEGVDWPECDRVISMYPPKTVTALVQMRGRARKKDSKFIVLCSSSEEEDKLADIMNREKNMIEATAKLVRLQENEECNIAVPMHRPLPRITTHIRALPRRPSILQSRNTSTLTRTKCPPFGRSCSSIGSEELNPFSALEAYWERSDKLPIKKWIEEIRSSRSSSKIECSRRTTIVQTSSVENVSYRANKGISRRDTISPLKFKTGKEKQEKSRKRPRSPVSQLQYLTDRMSSDDSHSDQPRKRRKLESPVSRPLCPVKALPLPCWTNHYSDSGQDMTQTKRESPVPRFLKQKTVDVVENVTSSSYFDHSIFFRRETNDAILDSNSLEVCDEHTQCLGRVTSFSLGDYSWESENNKLKRSRKSRTRKRESTVSSLLQKKRADCTEMVLASNLSRASRRKSCRQIVVSNQLEENSQSNDRETSFESRYDWETTKKSFKRSRRRRRRHISQLTHLTHSWSPVEYDCDQHSKRPRRTSRVSRSRKYQGFDLVDHVSSESPD